MVSVSFNIEVVPELTNWRDEPLLLETEELLAKIVTVDPLIDPLSPLIVWIGVKDDEIVGFPEIPSPFVIEMPVPAVNVRPLNTDVPSKVTIPG